MMLTLAACGGKNDVAQNTVDTGAADDAADTTVSDTVPETDAKDEAADSDADNTQSDAADGAEETDPVPALNRNDFTLKNVGDTFRLEVEHLPEGAVVTWSISDEAVATVAEDGTVTAVAAGTATATAAFGDVAMSCIVRVNAETADEGGAVGGNSLNAFVADVMGKYELPMGLMEVSEPELISNFFAGLSDIATEQVVVYLTMMGPMNGEIVAVEVKNGSDVAAVEKILNDRIAYMIDGGAFYPEATETWEKNAKVVSEGNFVLLVTSASCEAIAEDFRAFVK
jgi:hypothetical protein